MYIRQTTTRRKKDGSNYQSYRLVDSTRIGNKVKQRTLLNLGTGFSLPREQWGDLTNRIESILHHQPSLLAVDARIEAEAQRIAGNLLKPNIGLNASEVSAAMGTIMGRMAAPGSELSTHRWHWYLMAAVSRAAEKCLQAMPVKQPRSGRWLKL